VAGLVQALRALDLVVEPPPAALVETMGDGRATHAESDTRGVEVDPGLLWMLLRLYQELGAHAAPPVALPTSLQRAVEQRLSATQHAAAEAAAQDVLDQIESALAGYLRVPPWHLPFTEIDARPVIDAALAQGQDMEIDYWGADSNATTRRVTPYWIETRGDVPYLMAYCHLRAAERLFRLDRIAACNAVEG
jgi:hypothetical protein